VKIVSSDQLLALPHKFCTPQPQAFRWIQHILFRLVVGHEVEEILGQKAEAAEGHIYAFVYYKIDAALLLAASANSYFGCMKTITSDQLLADCLRELHFSEGLFPPDDMAQLKAIVERERAALEAEYDAKFKARIAKLITRKTIGRIISSGAANSATSNGGAL
jgi:hypothetical protein